MASDQYADPVDFLGGKSERIDVRFDAIEVRFNVLGGRLVRFEVGMEALRHDAQLLAEGLTATNQRLDRYQVDHEVRIRALEDAWFRP